MKILFQGDSITDADRTEGAGPFGLGYVKMLREILEDDLEIINRGVKNHGVADLAARWQADCLDIKPDILSLLIGVNDVWLYDVNTYPLDQFIEKYHYLIDSALEVSSPKIILMEPFLFEYENDRPKIDAKIEAVKTIAKEYDLPLIKLDSILHQYAKEYSREAVSADRVHPEDFGHKIITNHWLDVFEPIASRKYKRLSLEES